MKASNTTVGIQEPMMTMEKAEEGVLKNQKKNAIDVISLVIIRMNDILGCLTRKTICKILFKARKQTLC